MGLSRKQVCPQGHRGFESPLSPQARHRGLFCLSNDWIPLNIDLDSLPKLSDKRIALHVTPAAERALRKGHPWVYDQSIRKQSHEGQPGDLAVIFDHNRRFLAIGLYDPDSPIRVKVLQHRQQAAIDRAWFAERLRAAAALREPLLGEVTNGYRLLHGENDGPARG